jgi:hypothetical protein
MPDGITMKHTTEIVNTKQCSDESIAITIRCCDDPQTDSVLTVYGVSKLSEKQLAADVNKHHDRVALKHDGMQSGKHLLGTVIAQTKNHGGD